LIAMGPIVDESIHRGQEPATHYTPRDQRE